ncbi:alpha/beta hydrolase [Rhizobium daejeonense]|uniref:Alpha/beta hydrolase n=1 Tax=Rhizobium daejeonense TaxID=240521 RepID=A0A6M1S4R7_9HYPH|nr:alpha/beta fold hydrolase [Rhizobium daejeonense]NGO64317.1 alpha/beta hydrolase [Rhizobium daejeonense]
MPCPFALIAGHQAGHCPHFDPATIGADPEAYLAMSEARYADIRPHALKHIVWADPNDKAQSRISIIYIHGFSATAGELRPLPDLVATSLGANLFFTRLTGHGRSGDAMAEACLEAWLEDYSEALAIGERLGEKVVVMACSTGASLATYAMSLPQFSGRVAAAVFLSPNYAIANRGAFLLTLPFARLIAHLVLGSHRSFDPINAAHAKLWTTTYPVEALLPMAQLVRLASHCRVESFATPAFFIQSPSDRVVRFDKTYAVSNRWGGPHRLLDPGPVGDPEKHVIAGDALSPGTTAALARVIIDWLGERPELR